MDEIGRMSERTGASPRMLRHWEERGLLAPAGVDPVTSRRR
ncbi:MerR family DNA-binding transcriptional regulator [Litorihabitans aurantiacus]|nr:MerR family DNA-binding transcriptional regulator [Litorihabitans aurantiacus]